MKTLSPGRTCFSAPEGTSLGDLCFVAASGLPGHGVHEDAEISSCFEWPGLLRNISVWSGR